MELPSILFIDEAKLKIKCSSCPEYDWIEINDGFTFENLKLMYFSEAQRRGYVWDSHGSTHCCMCAKRLVIN